MIKSMYTGVSALKSNQTKMDVIANNVANSSTTGFKKSIARFQDALNIAITSGSQPTDTIGGIDIGQVGLGVKVSEISKVNNQGSIQITGKSTDMAINGEGLFMVSVGPITGTLTVDENTGLITDNNGPLKYSFTRDGSFSIDSNGYLSTADGYKVLGYSTNDDDSIDKTTIKSIEIPKTINVNGEDIKVNDFNISRDGTVIVSLEDRTSKTIGQISLATFANKGGLEAEGNNKFKDHINSGPPIISNNNSQIIQNSIEMSNVDLSEEFSEMIVTTRAFQAASKIISTSDDLLQEIINLKR